MKGVLITVAALLGLELEVFLELGADMGRLGKSSVFDLFVAAWFCFLGSVFL